MTKNELKEFKKEIEYYCGRKVSDQMAKEIKYFQEQNSNATLDEIISDYLACMEG